MEEKMKKYFMLVLIILFTGLFNYTKDNLGKIITYKMIKSFEKKIKITAQFKALMNALKNKQFKEIFLNRKILRNHSTNYTYELKHLK